MGLKKENVQKQDNLNEKEFSKKALLRCGEFKKDLINVLLENDKKYTKTEVKKIIDDFMKGGVC